MDERSPHEQFVAGEATRELALVALGAVRLARRAFPAGRERDALLLALALEPAETLRSLAATLALGNERTLDLLADLRGAGLVESVEIAEQIEHEEIPPDEVTWVLTARGERAALGVARRLGELLPSWPPGRAARRLDA